MIECNFAGDERIRFVIVLRISFEIQPTGQGGADIISFRQRFGQAESSRFVNRNTLLNLLLADGKNVIGSGEDG